MGTDSVPVTTLLFPTIVDIYSKVTVLSTLQVLTHSPTVTLRGGAVIISYFTDEKVRQKEVKEHAGECRAGTITPLHKYWFI